MELVDILVLGTSALVRVGSNPTEGNFNPYLQTKNRYELKTNLLAKNKFFT